MPLIKPVNKLYVKWLGEQFFASADAMECHSSHRIANESVGGLMGRPGSYGYVVTNVWRKMLGFIVFRIYPQEQKLHFIDLVVHPDHRNKGVGSKLVGRMQIKADEVKCILAPMRETNLVGHKFLRKNEFVAYRVLPDFYSQEWADGSIDKEDAYVFIHSSSPDVVEAAMKGIRK